MKAAQTLAGAGVRSGTRLVVEAPSRLAGRGASSNPAMAFPCLDALEDRSQRLQSERQSQSPRTTSSSSSRTSESGPEPNYTSGATLRYHCEAPLRLDWGGVLPAFDIAYETWGTLNADASNAILLHTGLSASSHAHSTELNPAPGWWEKFIGDGLALDTSKYFVICTNVLGGCYGSTGPSSIDPADGAPYATRFPILTMEDMVRAQFRLLDHLGISRLYASVGSSMGGMQSLAAGVLFPDRVGKIVSISGCARSHPYSIAMRHTQRQVLMMDPNWNRGFYYDRVPPHAGMKLAREIATVTYRSGPEWEQRFGRRRADPSKPPALCPDFLIETYLDHAGEKFCLTYDPNSLLYVSKAMDLFDLGASHQERSAQRRREREAAEVRPEATTSEGAACTLTLPDQPYEEQEPDTEGVLSSTTSTSSSSTPDASMMPGAPSWQPPADLVRGLAVLRNHPTLVMGVASDILFPAWQQYEVAEALKQSGNRNVSHYELSEQQSMFGHDTFLLDLVNIGGNHTPWIHRPQCVGQLPACVYTQDGLSLVTTPDVASDAAAAAYTTRQQSFPYEARDIPGKGKGAVATRAISRGEFIVEERPLLLARLDLFHGETNDHHNLLEEALAQLSEKDQHAVTSLARFRRDTSSTLVEDLLRTNGLGVTVGGVAHTALYTRIARLNHACRPNTFWRYSPRTLAVEFVALRDIAPGEELTHSYTQRDTVDATRAELLAHWGFNCTCEVCSSRDEGRLLDAKMARLKEIEGLLSDSNEDELERLTTEMMALVDGDDALRAPRGAYSYHWVVAAQAAWSAGFGGRALAYTEQALAAAVEYGGPDDEHVGVLQSVLRMMEK
ncbi:Serine O-succinyltransferase [Sporothrix eucalyptigena]|uniref:Serine O-succinyltransferase n=1 Tax=Sporothrix eucalyptigena TaxID=1812306 RepID=A0ABP0D436_9PEZI